MYCLQWQIVSLVATLRDRSFFIASHPQLQSSFADNYLCSSKGGVIYHGRISASATWESARRTGSRLVKQFGGQLNTVISLWGQCFGHRPWPRGGRARLLSPGYWQQVCTGCTSCANSSWRCVVRPLQPQGACEAARRMLLLGADGRWYRCWGQCHLCLLESWLCCFLCAQPPESRRDLNLADPLLCRLGKPSRSQPHNHEADEHEVRRIL